MQVGGTPSVRVCTEPARPGIVVKPQNVLGSLRHDLLSVTDKVMGPFTPVGFYYRTLIHPRQAWPLYERVLRNIAGLGRIDKHARRSGRFDVEHRRIDVLVIGGGRSGVQAARQAATQGRRVVLVDEQRDSRDYDLEGVEVLAPARAIGVYEGQLVPVDAGRILYRFRAQRIVVATGALEQPLLFPGNDLPGVMLPKAVRRMIDDWSIKPGTRAVVLSGDPEALSVAEDLSGAGVEVAEVVDLRSWTPRVQARASKGRLGWVLIDGREVECDLLVVSAGRQPNYSLLAQAGGRIGFDPAQGIFVPGSLPEGVEAVGSVTGDAGLAGGTAIALAGDRHGKTFVCICEDVTVKDVKRAIAEGFDSIELAKRYTTVTMGPCQGKMCHLPCIRMYAQETRTSEAAIGTTTSRPPWAPVTLGLLAGRGHEPAERTSMHHRHKALGARMMWTGSWRRPHSYGDPGVEVRAVHDALGIIDVSTLGKLLVTGRDAARFLERMYPNRFADLKPGRVRYGVLQTDGARIFDDGTVARLAEEEFYVTTTSTGAESVVEWFEWWNAIWRLDVEIVNITGALAAVNVAGPRVRDLMARITRLDVSNESFKYLDLKRARVAGVPSLLLRIGFVGELGYEIHVPTSFGEYLWDTILELGADLGIRPFGVEAQRILRLEKLHILAGQDTDSESNVVEANMPWIVKWDKDDFVGKWALEHVRERGLKARLVGFEMENHIVPPEGGQILVGGRPQGRVTSSRWSAEVGKVIGMAWVPADLAEDGTPLSIKVNGGLERAHVRLQPFFDPEGRRLRS
jgi:sarcosine oxidase subunit alpha